jgi:hypothetical protein
MNAKYNRFRNRQQENCGLRRPARPRGSVRHVSPSAASLRSAATKHSSSSKSVITYCTSRCYNRSKSKSSAKNNVSQDCSTDLVRMQSEWNGVTCELRRGCRLGAPSC